MASRADLLVLLGTPGLSLADTLLLTAAVSCDRLADVHARSSNGDAWDAAILERTANLARLSPEARHWLANYSAGIRPETTLGGTETGLGAPDTPTRALGDAARLYVSPAWDSGCCRQWDDGNGVTVRACSCDGAA